MSNVLVFSLFKTVDHSEGVPDKPGKSDLLIYEALYGGDLVVGYLYVTSDQYSLVWRSSNGFSFEMPYTVVELQFSSVPTWRVIESKPSLPLRNHPMELKGYDNKKAIASLVFRGEDEVKEFDLRTELGKSTYRAQLLDQEGSVSNLAFARYDSEILFRGEPQNVCFTAERMTEANDDWEFVINLSRANVLNPRSLRWVIQHHELSEAMLKMDFEASHVALSGVLSR